MSDQTIKLQKFIAQAGICSRRKAEELIDQKKVEVNGKLATIGQRVNPAVDQVKVQGKTIVPTSHHVYYLVNKPVGLVSTNSDDQGRKTVMSLLPKTEERIFIVGRLDIDSEGLMLLTNDGDLAFKWTHPKFQVHKTYHVMLDRTPTYKAIQHLRKGVKLKEGFTKKAQVDLLKDDPDKLWLEITITEGRNRQIRRMMERVGYDVQRLIRVKLAKYELDQLGDKKWIKVDHPDKKSH